MKKQIAAVYLCMLASSAMAQSEVIGNRLANIDWKEDSTEIVTVNDIIKTQQAVATRTAQSDHFAQVWGHRGFFNISYHTKATLTPKIPASNATDHIYETSIGEIPDFKANWGASIQVGKSIKMHKKPIANTLCFNLDYTGVDLNFNHYKAELGGNNNYDSSQQRTVTNDDGSTNNYYFLHWNSEKYEVSYGMMIGPSITLAPFTHIKDARAAHHLKFNFYYHIGYRASFLYMVGEPESDVQYANLPPKGTPAYKTALDLLDQRNDNQFVVGHGLYQSLGFNMVWKRIGIGYEHTWGNKLKYKNLTSKSEYGSEKYKFDTVTNRVYLTYRFGK